MATIKKNQSKLRGARLIIKEEGVLSLIIRSLQKVQKIQQRKSSHKQRMIMLAAEKDIIAAEWVNSTPTTPVSVSTPCTLAWVMSPPGESGGGHQNIFRFIKFLDKQGYRNIVYLYSTSDFPTTELVRERIKGFYDIAPENLKWLDKDGQNIEGDAIFATGWETAYPVYNTDKSKKKFYFVQDFEPLFYPMGSEYILAENTYKFGFTGITAGKWLTEKLQNEYGMHCQYFDFGAEPAHYRLSNPEERKEIFFYARPITTRRGFELGIMTLHKFHQKHPEYTINLAGWDVSEYSIPFPYVNHKALKIDQLSDLYNKCAAALVISLTNMSLLPLELLATGTIPVVNDGPNNRLVSDNPYIKYATASPDALAEALHEAVTRPQPVEYAKEAAASVKSNGWEKSGEKFVNIVEAELHG
jgi:hypothetical protein